jgi:hypothetical protein
MYKMEDSSYVLLYIGTDWGAANVQVNVRSTGPNRNETTSGIYRISSFVR